MIETEDDIQNGKRSLVDRLFNAKKIAERNLLKIEGQILQDSRNGNPPSTESVLNLLRQQLLWELHVLWELRDSSNPEKINNLIDEINENVFSSEVAQLLLLRTKIYKEKRFIALKRSYLEGLEKLGDDLFSTIDPISWVDDFFSVNHDVENPTKDPVEANIEFVGQIGIGILEEWHEKRDDNLWIARYLEKAFFKLATAMKPDDIVDESLLKALHKEQKLLSEFMEGSYATIITRSNLLLLLKVIFPNHLPVYEEITHEVNLEDMSTYVSTHLCRENVWFICNRVIVFSKGNIKYRVVEGGHIDYHGNSLTNHSFECYWQRLV